MTEFRNEIQGLRALAVVLVVLFHVKAAFVPGGYIGVDVFFVISGFLITGKLVREQDGRGSIDYLGFLAGRMRRLFPAFFVTMAATFVASYYLLPPQDLQRFASGTFYALLYLSNIFYWSESGYFDAVAYTKPDLHTWSLSVEEQFYWVWPLLLMLFGKKGRRAALVLFVLVFTLSMLANIALLWAPRGFFTGLAPALGPLVLKAETSTFFLMPFRMYEFAIGALCFLASERSRPGSVLATAMQAVGLVMIGVAAVWFTEATPFPGVAALLPCVGTALVIAAGQAGYLGKLLSNPVTNFLGRTSYSIYLVHWPIIVLYLAFYQVDVMDLPAAAALFAASIVLGYALHAAIEYPFWKYRYLPNVKPAGFVALSLVCILAFSLPLTSAWATGGWGWRFGPNGSRLNLETLEQETLVYEQTRLTGNYRGDRRRIVVIGDSHARDTANGLDMVLPQDMYQVKYLFSLATCIKPTPQGQPGQTCPRLWDRIRASTNVTDADIIVLSFRWSEAGARQLPEMLSELKAVSKTPGVVVLVTGRVVQPSVSFLKAVPWLARDGKTAQEINESAIYSLAYSDTVDAILADVVSRTQNPDMRFWRKSQSQCPGRKCRFIDQDMNLFIWDVQHLTLIGARHVAQDLVRSLPALFPLTPDAAIPAVDG